MADIHELPIDQYQRYMLASQAVNVLRRDKKPFRILEAGGYPPKLKNFLPDDYVLITDRTEHNDPDYMRADAVALPFAEDSFDVVISLDVLEHIPESDRLDFIESLKSVSGGYIILAAPFDDGLGLIKDAETMLVDFISDRLGFEHQYFLEHLANGLPNLESTRKEFVSDGWDAVILPCGYFTRWFGMTLLEYALEGRIDEDVHAKMRRHYNLYFYPMDNCEPAYRHFIVASKNGFSDTEKQKIKALKSSAEVKQWPPLEYARTLVELARLDAHDVMEAKIKGLEHDLAARDEEIKYLNQHIKELNVFADKIKRFLPYRIYSKIFK